MVEGHNNKKKKIKKIKQKRIQDIRLTKMTSEKLDVIGIYRSKEGNLMNLISYLEDLINDEKTTILGGDMNICLLKKPNNYATEGLTKIGFKQIVTKATHIEGGLIDHVYIKEGPSMKFSWVLEDFPKYYSDHDGLCLTLCQVND